MNFSNFGIGLPIRSALLSLAVALTATQAANSARVQLVIVGDTLDRRLGQDVQVDIGAIGRTFKAWNDTRVLEPKVISDEACTPGNIVQALESLSLQPDDAVVFFYSGHGGRDQAQGDFLQFPRLGQSGYLMRSQIRDRIEGWVNARQIRLGVIITDMCNQLFVLPPGPPGAFVPAPQRNLLMESLFIYSSGLLDINSADTDQVAMSIPPRRQGFGADHFGGIFTEAFTDFLMNNSGSALNWSQVMDKVQSEMQLSFRTHFPNGIHTPTGNLQLTQTIKRVSLPKTVMPTGGVTDRSDVPSQESDFKPARPKRLGIMVDPNPRLVMHNGRWEPGMTVLSVNSVAPAQGYIDPGDVILTINGQRTRNYQQMLDAIESAESKWSIFGYNSVTQRVEHWLDIPVTD